MSGAASDPCFDQAADMLSVDEAIAALLDHALPLAETESIDLIAAPQRVLGQAVSSPINVPGFDNSAMDGYALNTGDVEVARTDGLAISQRIPAGSTGVRLETGTCARIFTGAPIPEGADAVAIQEVCRIDNNRMFIDQAMSVGENIRPCGNDISAGTEILQAGTLLGPAAIGLIASVGIKEVTVARRLKVAMFSSGDELVEPGETLQPGQIYNSNRPLIRAMLERQGCTVIDLGTVADTFAATRDTLLKAAQQADLVMSSGGVSVGEEDHIKAALESVGELNLWRIRMKPGKPLAFGKIGDTPFIGLPGNPVSVFVTFILFGRPFILKQQGRNETNLPRFPVTARFNYTAKKRREFVRVRLISDPLQGLLAECYPKQGSDVLSSAAWATGLIEVPESTTIASGDIVSYLPFSECL